MSVVYYRGSINERMNTMLQELLNKTNGQGYLGCFKVRVK